MKTKNKLLTAIVLCSMLLVALPAIASAQEDETLDIYGNANEDDIIDMRDLTFTARMILRLEDETELADANYDERISVADMTQIGLIILGRESKLTLVDAADRIVTVNKPVEKIVFTHPATAEGISILGAGSRVVGREYTIPSPEISPWLSELPCVNGPMFFDIDYEMVFELDPDIFLTAITPMPGFEDVVATLEPEIQVVALNFFEPRTLVENTRKLRYVLNTEEKGEEFIAWYEGAIDSIAEKTAGLSEDEKQRVFLKISAWARDELSTFTDKVPAVKYQMEIAGGINVAADWPSTGGRILDVDPEAVIDANPDTIVASVRPAFDPSSFGYDVDDTSVAMALREEYMSMDAFAGSDAVNEGRVYLYPGELINTPRFVVGVAYLARWFHPTLFSDLDPQAIHQQYLTDFMRIDYDLGEHGVFAFPEEPV